ncbi:hypothetical protein [Flindersiella endophytica]
MEIQVTACTVTPRPDHRLVFNMSGSIKGAPLSGEAFRMLRTDNPLTKDSTDAKNPGVKNFFFWRDDKFDLEPNGQWRVDQVIIGYAEYCGIAPRFFLVSMPQALEDDLAEKLVADPRLDDDGFTADEVAGATRLDWFEIPTRRDC